MEAHQEEIAMAQKVHFSSFIVCFRLTRMQPIVILALEYI